MSEIKTSNITENKMFKLLTEANATIRKLEIKLDKLMDTNIQLMEAIQEKDKTIADLTEQLLTAHQSNQDIKEQLQSMNKRLFGRKSEKRSKPGSSADHNTNKEEDDDDDENNDHLSSASSSPDSVLPDLEDNSVQQKRLRRKKSSSGKKKRAMQKMIEDYDLKPEVVIHTLKEDERRCSKCGTALKQMGTKLSHYQIRIIPAKIIVEEHRQATYSCPECKKNSRQSDIPLEDLNLTPINAPLPPSFLEGTWATPEFVAYMIVTKAHYLTPTYRTGNQFAALGNYFPSNSTVTEWIIKTNQLYLTPYCEYAKKLLVRRRHLCADETTLQVINESINRRGVKSYLWQYRTVEDDPIQLALFEYCQGRAGAYAAKYLENFEGTLLVDGFTGYNKVENVKLAYCHVHSRRYFLEATASTRNKAVISLAEKALTFFDQIFEVEDKIEEKKLYGDQKRQYRYHHTLPIVKKLFDWVATIKIENLSSEKLRKAFNYLLKHKDGLEVFLDDPMIPATNNGCEQGFVPVSRGRNNWLFAYCEEGAATLASMFSIVQTACLNHLNPFQYVTHVLTTLTPWVNKGKEIPEKVLAALMPWSVEIQSNDKLFSEPGNPEHRIKINSDVNLLDDLAFAFA